MKIKKSVFGSEPENKVFYSLKSKWDKHFNLYPGLPFSQIVDNPESFLNDKKELEFFYITSIDFTLCNKDNDEPILSIEFDGIGKGFSRDGEYVRVKKPKSKYRKRKMDLKLKIAEELNYPFFVISFEETEKIHPEINLTIVDGIIGKYITQKKLPTAFKEAVENYREYLDALPDETKKEYIFEFFIGVEVENELKWNPIAKMACDLQYKLVEMNIYKSLSISPLRDPELNTPDLLNSSKESIEEYFQKFKKIERHGCKIELETTQKTFTKTIWLRNISGFDINSYTFIDEIAEILIYKEALDYYENDAGNQG
jgi:hypothetical protein